MKANVYKVELLVIDHENMGEQAVRETLENQNRYVSPHVMAIEGQQVDWDDAHPLNNTDTQEAAFMEMFGGPQSAAFSIGRSGERGEEA